MPAKKTTPQETRRTAKKPATPIGFKNTHKRYYPAFVDIEGKKCVIAGGGKVAERKARDLLKAGADVRVISPELSTSLTKLSLTGKVRHSARRFRASDLKGAFMAIAATDDMEINQKVAAHSRSMLVNVVDEPGLCSFIVPSALRRGPLTVAVSTSGASPAMARAIRQELEGMFGPEVGEYLSELCAIRKRIIKDIPEPKERERKLKELGSAEALSRLISKGSRGSKKNATAVKKKTGKKTGRKKN